MKRTILRTATVLTLALALLTGCASNRAQSSALLGTLAGSTLGALTFKNKISGAAIGGGVGLLVGYIVGNEMDKNDSGHVTQALETVPSGHEVVWVNPDTRTHYRAVPRPPRLCPDGRIEREFALEARMDNGRMETVHGRAFRRPDGSWQLVQ
jgi:surface antigen